MKPLAVSLSIVAGLLLIGVVILLIATGGNLRAALGIEERTLMSWTAQSQVASLKIESSDDNVVFRASDDGSFSVTYYQSDTHSFDITQDGSKFSMIGIRKWLPSFGLGRDYTITVTMPAGELEKLDVSVSSGRIEFGLGIRAGSLSAHTSSGNITLENFTADTLYAGATSGNVTIGNVMSGTAETRVSSGSITLSNVSANILKTSATSGITRLENCGIRQLDMHSTSGNITGKSLDLGTMAASVTSGNVDLEIATSDPALYKMELSSTSGGIKVSGGGYDASTSRNLSLGSGDQLVKVQVTSGNIAVRFKDAASQ